MSYQDSGGVSTRRARRVCVASGNDAELDQPSAMRVAFGGGGDADDERSVLDVFGSWVGDGRLLYVPIAADPPFEPYLEWARTALAPSGISTITMATSAEQTIRELSRSDGVFISGGNTYALLHALRASGAERMLRRAAGNGCPVYGGSAGAILLGRDIDTARHNDRNVVGLADPAGLDLALGYSIWCHYVPSDDARIRDFVTTTRHEAVAISERGGLSRIGSTIRVIGPEPARLFDPRGISVFNVGDLLPPAKGPDGHT